MSIHQARKENVKDYGAYGLVNEYLKNQITLITFNFMLPPDYIIQEIRIQNPEVHQSLVKHFKEWNNNEPHESDYILYLHLMRYK